VTDLMSITRLFVASLLVQRGGFAMAEVDSAAHPNSATTVTEVVMCTNLASGARWEINIDRGRHTVDSYPARFSAEEISWHDLRDGGHYTLDRKSGKLTVVFASSTGGYFIYDRCQLKN